MSVEALKQSYHLMVEPSARRVEGFLLISLFRVLEEKG